MRDRKEGGVTEERQKKYVGKYIREWDRGGWENSDMGEVCNILIFVIQIKKDCYL